MLRKGGGHLQVAGVVDADEQDLGDVRRRIGECDDV